MALTYSFGSVSCNIVGPGGAFALGSGSGAAEGGITISMAEDKSTQTVGSDGTVMYSLHKTKAATITVSLLKTSPTNQKLSLMYALQTAAPALHGTNTILLFNSDTNETISMQQVAFQKLPDNVSAKDGNNNDWLFQAGVVDQILSS